MYCTVAEINIASLDADCDEHESISRPKFLGKPVDLTEIPQYVMEYERGTDVELWQIKYDKMGNLLE